MLKYIYDSWGVPTTIRVDYLDEITKEIIKVNTFMYKGYLYDSESQMYYLITRYYDPRIKRFISPDSVLSSIVNSIFQI